MSLMRWFRKYNRKIIAVAVVGLMVVFIGGSALQRGCGGGGPSPKQALAKFSRKGQITRIDIDRAQMELSILKGLGADRFLVSQDIDGVFLSELLFSEGRTASQIIGRLRQAVRQQGIRISDEQLMSIYRKEHPSEIYWLLLSAEARSAGVVMSVDLAEKALRRAMPKVVNGWSYAAVMNGFIGRGISQEQVLGTFSKLYSILEYARLACGNENLTSRQLSHLADFERQPLDIEFVRVQAEMLTDDPAKPKDEQVRQQFEEYKDNYPGQVTEGNPYGFGYKLGDMVKFEYIYVKSDDVRKVLPTISQEQMHAYYQLHRNEYVRTKPLDPADPNSESVEYTLSFGQVAKEISNRLRTEMVEQKAETILGQARRVAESGYGDNEISKMKSEQFKSLAGDYDEIAKLLAKEYDVPVKSGSTGFLNFADVQVSKNASGLYVKSVGPDQVPAHITQMIFSVDELGTNYLGLAGIAQPRLFENIGPMSDISGKIFAIVRVVDVRKAAAPDDVGSTFTKNSIEFEEDTAPNIFKVRDNVIEDLKMLAAMEKAKTEADKYLAIANKDGWDKASEQFNKRFSIDDPNDPNSFKLITFNGLKKITSESLVTSALHNESLPGAYLNKAAQSREAAVIARLYSLVPLDSAEPRELPLAVQIKAGKAYYCIKSLKITRIDRDQYDRSKAILAFSHDARERRIFSVEHFQPANILKRTNFKFTRENARPADPNETDAQEEP